MNVFELGIIAAPIAGLVAGSRAATGHGPTVIIVCSLGGLLIGAAAYFGPVFASGFIWSRVRDPKAPPDRPGSVAWVAGTAVVLLAALSPLIAWVVAGVLVSRLLLGFAG